MSLTPAQEERLEALASERALAGLDAAEQAELDRLLAISPEGRQLADELERAAAALALGSLAVEAMPSALGERILAASSTPPMQQTVLQHTAVMPGAVPVRPAFAPSPAPVPSVAPVIPLAQPAPRGGRALRAVAVAGWLAAAAAVVLAVGVASTRRPSAVAAVDPAAARAALLAKPGTTTWSWTPNEKDPAGRAASGDVVWNAAEQRGFMRFKGLAKNDAQASVYQLWIFDRGRDERYPVDGGVFSIADGAGEVVVPIDARLAVADPTLFAVTVEKPGGVVVSSRERIVTTAAAKAL